MGAADLHFYFDPVCPFAWMTSRWVRTVAARRSYTVDWRFLALRIVNEDVDYAARFPPEYEAGHTAGLRLLRVAAHVRAGHGREAVGTFYSALGQRLFETGAGGKWAAGRDRDIPAFVAPVLADAGLPHELVGALDDDAQDAVIRAETEEALALTGRDVGTPILHFEPARGADGGTAFFGPVISRLPSEDRAVELWDHVVGLARFPGFAELKRSLRERPQLPALGVPADEVGVREDWHGGSRRQQR